jgi:hypothetical protein
MIGSLITALESGVGKEEPDRLLSGSVGADTVVGSSMHSHLRPIRARSAPRIL